MQKIRGFSMIEILITFVIMAVGLLGLAGMQNVNLKNVNNTQYRTLATIFAYDMAERMRSNRDGLGAYNGIDGSETDPNCTTCNATEMAQLDAFQWNQAIGASVVDGGMSEGAVGTVSSNGNLWDIKVSWPEQTRDQSGGKIETKEFTLSIRI